METHSFTQYSERLQRSMPIRIYGWGGRPILFLPCQDGHAVDFENFRMSDVLAPWIDAGRCMVFSIDTVDAETWSDRNGDPHRRMQLHERWIEYITRELVPFLRERAGLPGEAEENPGVMVFGCSMGASHALNLYLRFPNLFDRCLALSGVYNASFFLGDYMDELVYQNSPVDYMANFPADHPFVPLYNRHRAVLCTGQGAWEVPWSTRRMDELFRERGIQVRTDYWGFDVNHDWPWWYKQTAYFLPDLLE